MDDRLRSEGLRMLQANSTDWRIRIERVEARWLAGLLQAMPSRKHSAVEAEKS
jgi:hypothetical protein